tara:strand:+ start:237 stop:434 length:198 start_codon:yes stop_codon:yes gene_type:complete
MMCIEKAHLLQGTKHSLRLARLIFQKYHELLITKAQEIVVTDPSEWCGAGDNHPKCQKGAETHLN